VTNLIEQEISLQVRRREARVADFASFHHRLDRDMQERLLGLRAP